MITFLRKLFDTSNKDIAAVQPLVEDINNFEPTISELTDDELRAKGDEFRKRMADGATPESILTEVFATVREISKRTLNMRHFDVQMIGGIVLHQGKIAEMRTGEGKTLVAVAPMALNALTGRGAHLVTVNDYLARRDATWMGPIYHFLGLSVGIVQGQGADSDELGGSYIYEPGFQHQDPRYNNLRPCTRRESYLCDLTYGTNHEFGFDYLRDNMAFEKDQLSMRELNFALIDEVDSILIDEARTPHIISGPSMEDVSIYVEINAIVKDMTPEEHFTWDKKSHSASFTEDGMDYLEQALGIENIANEPRMFHHAGAAIKAYSLFEKDVNYVVRNGEVVIVDENTGRMMFGRRYSDGLHQALEAKEGVQVQRESQTVAVITFQNLFRMYNKLCGMTGTAKTEEDEFRKIYGLDVVAIPTHRPMVRQDQEDIVYKSMDAKFRGFGREIMRLYTKQQPILIGTRSIEMTEKVSARMTGEPLQKLLLVDMALDKVENEKSSKSFAKEAEVLSKSTIDELKMSTIKNIMASGDLPTDPLSDDVLDWFLKKHKLPMENKVFLVEALSHGIPHNVLNAKYHEQEALIISEAGRKGAVTIATNMAGRGVDILLGGRVHDEEVKMARAREEEGTGLLNEYGETFTSYRRGGQERAAPPLPLDDTERRVAAEEVRALGGLYVLGTDRHESRRIDNQLRGRAGRQGDPGESRFYVSLEDELWRVFNKNMMDNPVLKAWPEQEEVRAKMISGMILKTQERIENHYFEARKHILEYDDVLNSQREHIYAMRRETLLGKDCRGEILAGISDFIVEAVGSGYEIDPDTGDQVYDDERIYEKLNDHFPLVDHLTPSEFSKIEPGQKMIDQLSEIARKEYDAKTESYGEDMMKELERHVMLRAVNDNWMEHLQMIDYIREGIGLRGYGQTDPLVAYKKETFDLFQHTLKAIRDQAVKMAFTAQIRIEQPAAATPEVAPEMMMMEIDGPGTSDSITPVDLDTIDWKKVGRNENCPCGSGKKFKACHYPLLRQEGKI